MQLNRQNFSQFRLVQLLIFNICILSTILAQLDIDSSSSYDLTISREKVRAGEVVSIILDFSLKKNFYIYSSHPNKSLSPTEINWEDSLYFNVLGILQEPKPKIKFDPNFSMDIGYHTQSVKFKQDFLIADSLEPGNYKVNGTFIYQVCDPTRCIPRWDDIYFNLLVESGESEKQFVSDIQTSHEINKLPSLGSNVSELNEVISKGLISFILFAIGMGFLALLTPCVFPMIPITVSFFTKLGEKEDSSPLSSAIIYTLGIIIIFTCLGLILAFTLGAAGANQLASNPWINLFIAALFIYFAFSLFGHYEIQIPSALRQFSSQQEQKGGRIGILFMALTFTLTSFTCTVQFVGLLLVAASQGEYFWPIIGMLAFSTAFASPFFLLALFPQYLAKLPQSGGWLNSVKVTMGFLELGAAMKFLSNADLVWEWGIVTQPAVLSSWIIISFMMGLYLLGKIKLPHDTALNSIGVPRLIMSIIFLSFSIYLTAGLFGQPLHGLIDSYLPPKINEHVNDNSLKFKDDEIFWYDDLSEALEVAKKIDKPVFIDFTGYTCTNCRWMETNIFEEFEVKELFKQFVMTRLYTDGGKNYRENQKLEIERFGTAALPFYVVLSPFDEELSRFPGMDTDVKKFINFLEVALINNN